MCLHKYPLLSPLALIGLAVLVLPQQVQANPPQVIFTVEPLENDAVVYLAIAAKTGTREPKGQLSLRLEIKNQEMTPVQLNKVELSFPDRPNMARTTMQTKFSIGAKRSAV